MNVYEFRHGGHYLGGLSIVVAESLLQAIELTRAALIEHKLSPNGMQFVRQINTEVPRCFVLEDGDY
jgi:hypothetical protein